MPGKVRDDIRTMSGLERAAALLLALGEEHTSKVFALMADDEIKELSSSMATLGAVSPEVLDKICIEFAEQISSTGALIGSFDTTERLLSKAMPADRVAQLQQGFGGGQMHRRVIGPLLRCIQQFDARGSEIGFCHVRLSARQRVAVRGAVTRRQAKKGSTGKQCCCRNARERRAMVHLPHVAPDPQKKA